jgi:putative Mn2+ efflux pump MntP
MFSILLIALALAADAFAVAVANGITMKSYTVKYSLIFGFYFGFFQFAMPIIGFVIGRTFSAVVQSWSSWFAFALLLVIGLKMIWESTKSDIETDTIHGVCSVKNMSALALATSLDAMAVGVNFALMGVRVWTACATIGVVAFVLSAAGVAIGQKVGGFFQKGAERIGGAILILIGFRILLESLLR